MEGEFDDFALSFLARRIAPEIEFTPPLIYQGKKRLPKVLLGYLAAFRFGAQQGAQPILHRDSNGEDPSKVERELRKFCPDSVSLVIPVQETEAWLLADPIAFRKTFRGVPLPGGAPETLPNPKEILRALAPSGGGHLTKERLGALLEGLDITVLQDRCPSFRKFVEMLEGLRRRS